MKILAIETSTMVGSVALIDNGRIIGEYTLNQEFTHSTRLMGAIKTIMDSCGLLIGKLDGVAVSIGPGSFTGLRIGLSTAKGIAFSEGKPLVSIPTLDGMAQNLAFCYSVVCPLLDARKKQIYTALYRRGDGGRMVKIGPEIVIFPQEFLSRISEETIFFGSGAQVYGELIRSMLGGKARFAPPHLNFPRAASIAWLAAEKLSRGESADLTSLCPLYIRKSEAEIKPGGANEGSLS